MVVVVVVSTMSFSVAGRSVATSVTAGAAVVAAAGGESSETEAVVVVSAAETSVTSRWIQIW